MPVRPNYSKLIESGVETWNLWRAENPDDAGDLSGLDLSEGYFFEANFQGTNLSHTNLKRACLIGANLQTANLSQANLGGTYAGDSDLRGANLTGANLENTNFNRADLRDAVLLGTNIHQADTFQAKLPKDTRIKAYSHSLEHEATAFEPPVGLTAKSVVNPATNAAAHRDRQNAFYEEELSAAIALATPSKAFLTSHQSPNRSPSHPSPNHPFPNHYTTHHYTKQPANPRTSRFHLPALDSSLLRRLVQKLVNRPVIYTATILASSFLLYKITVQDNLATEKTAVLPSQTNRATQSDSAPFSKPLELVNALESNSEIWSIDTHTETNGELLIASGERNGQIKLWNGQTGDVIRTLSGHEETVRALTISRSGQRLASSGKDGVKVWDTRTGALIYSLPSAGPIVWAIAISPDDSALISGHADGLIMVRQIETGLPLYSLDNGSPVWSIAIAPDGDSFITGGQDHAQQWDLANGWSLQTFSGHKDAVRSVAISADGQTLATGSWDSTVKLWNLTTGELKASLAGHQDRVVSVAMNDEGTHLASGGIDNTIRLWQLRDRALVETIEGTHWILDLAFATSKPVATSEPIAMSEQILISTGKDQSIKLWR